MELKTFMQYECRLCTLCLEPPSVFLLLWFEERKQICVIKAGLLGFYTVQYIGFLPLLLSSPSWYVYSIRFTCVLRWIWDVSIMDQRSPLYKQIMIPLTVTKSLSGQWELCKKEEWVELAPYLHKGFLSFFFFFFLCWKN